MLNVLLQNLGESLAEGANLVTGEKNLQLEWLQGELLLMHAFLDHVETVEGLGPTEKDAANAISEIATQAKQVVDTFIQNSLRERRRGGLKRRVLVFKTWKDKYHIARKTKKIKRRISYVFGIIEGLAIGEGKEESFWGIRESGDEVRGSDNVGVSMDQCPVRKTVVSASTGRKGKFDEEIWNIQSYVSHMDAAAQEQLSARDKVLMVQMREIITFADAAVNQRRRLSKTEQLGVLIEGLRERMDAYYSRNANWIMTSSRKPRILPGKEVGTLDTKVNRIKRDLEMMHALFEDVGPVEELDGKTRVWVGEVMGVAQNIEFALLNDDNISLFSIFDLKSLSKFEKQVNQILDRIQNLSRRRKLYRINLTTRRPQDPSPEEEAPPLPPTYTANLESDDCMHAIMDWILADDEHQRIVSIVGVKGTGKSTLARLVYNNQTVQNHFVYGVWVDLCQSCQTRRANEILQEIQEKVRSVELVPWNEITEETIQGGTVHSTEGRYIIVFNGVCSTEFRDLMEKAFPDTSQGSRIIVTTTNIGAAPRAGPNKFTLKLALLTDDHSWELFTRTLGMCVLPESDLMKLRRKILRTCGGLPLYIKELGRQLSSAEPTSEAWSRVIESFNGQQKPWLDSSVISDFPLNLRRCLQYFEKFPPEFEIPVRRLIALWVAEGLVRGGRDPPENIAKRILAELIDRNMVQVTERKLTGEVKACCMPLALRELNLKEEIRSYNRPRVTRLADHLDQQDSSFKHIHGDSSNLSDSELRAHYEHTSSFLSFDTREGSKPGEEIGNFLDRCVSSGCFLLLRVLDLERVFRPKLPQDIGKLILLSYLGLRWTFLETLPSNVSQLLGLQTLDVKHTYISKLPSSIWKMENLRHLYLNESYRCRFPARPSHTYLKNLQTLWGVFIDEESPVKDGLDTLTNLKKLGLASRLMSSHQLKMQSRLKAVADWVQKLDELESLRLKSYNEEGKPWDLPLKSLSSLSNLSSMYLLGRIENEFISSGLPQGLTYLTLSGSGLTSDPMHVLRNLRNLKFLRLLSGSFEGKIMLCSSGGFLQLQVLKLWKLEELEELVVEEGALPELRDLEIRSCVSLKAIPKGLQNVSTLKELKLSKMSDEFMNNVDRAQVHYAIKED